MSRKDCNKCKRGSAKVPEYQEMCGDCGKKKYPNADESKFNGITVSMGKCPVCKKEKGIIPSRDWAWACQEKVVWD